MRALPEPARSPRASRRAPYNHRVRKVSTAAFITTVAGGGPAGLVPDGGPATAGLISRPIGVAVDAEGNLFIAVYGAHRVRKVDAKGVITTVAGDGQAGYRGDGGPATAARFNVPTDLAAHDASNLYIADPLNNRIRRIDSSGIITTVAGNGTAGYEGEGVPATSARLYSPYGLALDRAGNLYISDTYNHRVRGVSSVATMAPPPLPSADLYGEVVSVPSVHRGQEFDLGARVKNRGPNPADGKDVTVVLTLADALRGPAGTTGPLSRTFTGQQLQPHQGSLDGVFRVHAPDGTPPGLYTSTLEIQYGGDPNLTDNTYTLPVTVVAAAPPLDERALTITQDSLLVADPGQRTAFTVRFDSPSGQPVNPGDVVHRFTAPTGFVFTGQPVYGYYNTIHRVIAGNLAHRIEDDGRTLIVTANLHINTTTSDTGPLYYTIPVQARPDAAPGTYQDGSANVGKHPRAPLTGSPQTDTALRVTQKTRPRAGLGQSTVFTVEIDSRNNQPVDPGTIEYRFVAPTGFAFTGASYAYHDIQPDSPTNLDTHIEDDGTTLTFLFNPHVNTQNWDRPSLIYSIGIRALPGADRGTHDDGAMAIGNLLPVPLTATVD
ncbi:hypothetical protein ACFXAZ_09975 [Streptomyces sp. NPDC059477]|uniref:hypothetical protein n=1 Tax=Streptomyces sp. NPDC059477 TaxID=3346847 RepID=UPI003698886A